MQAKFQDYSPEDFKAAVLKNVTDTGSPLEEMIELCDNLFELIDLDKSIPEPVRNTVWHLFKTYALYRDLVGRKEGRND